jgi:hypothetical protein
MKIFREPMNFNMAPEENIYGIATTTMDLIKKGLRKSTTKASWINGVPKQGQIIEFYRPVTQVTAPAVAGPESYGDPLAHSFNLMKKSQVKGQDMIRVVVTNVTKVPEKPSGAFIEQWSKKEGWTPEAAAKHGFLNGYQVEFRIAEERDYSNVDFGEDWVKKERDLNKKLKEKDQPKKGKETIGKPAEVIDFTGDLTYGQKKELELAFKDIGKIPEQKFNDVERMSRFYAWISGAINPLLAKFGPAIKMEAIKYNILVKVTDTDYNNAPANIFSPKNKKKQKIVSAKLVYPEGKPVTLENAKILYNEEQIKRDIEFIRAGSPQLAEGNINKFSPTAFDDFQNYQEAYKEYILLHEQIHLVARINGTVVDENLVKILALEALRDRATGPMPRLEAEIKRLKRVSLGTESNIKGLPTINPNLIYTGFNRVDGKLISFTKKGSELRKMDLAQVTDVRVVSVPDLISPEPVSAHESSNAYTLAKKTAEDSKPDDFFPEDWDVGKEGNKRVEKAAKPTQNAVDKSVREEYDTAASMLGDGGQGMASGIQLEKVNIDNPDIAPNGKDLASEQIGDEGDALTVDKETEDQLRGEPSPEENFEQDKSTEVLEDILPPVEEGKEPSPSHQNLQGMINRINQQESLVRVYDVMANILEEEKLRQEIGAEPIASKALIKFLNWAKQDDVKPMLEHLKQGVINPVKFFQAAPDEVKAPLEKFWSALMRATHTGSVTNEMLASLPDDMKQLLEGKMTERGANTPTEEEAFYRPSVDTYQQNGGPTPKSSRIRNVWNAVSRGIFNSAPQDLIDLVNDEENIMGDLLEGKTGKSDVENAYMQFAKRGKQFVINQTNIFGSIAEHIMQDLDAQVKRSIMLNFKDKYTLLPGGRVEFDREFTTDIVA